jgi:uncharacterized membrane protein YcjF (UPF0283 family)
MNLEILVLVIGIGIVIIIQIIAGLLLLLVDLKYDKNVGFRTRLSQKNQANFTFSNILCGKLLIIFSGIEILIIVPLSIWFLQDRPWLGYLIIASETVIVLIIMLIVNIKLKAFDKLKEIQNTKENLQ